jgi:hypothetical protein
MRTRVSTSSRSSWYADRRYAWGDSAPRGLRLCIDLLLLCAVVAVATLVTFELQRSMSPPIGSRTTPQVESDSRSSQVIRAAERWAAGNLPAGTRVGVDPAVARDLAANTALVPDVLGARGSQLEGAGYVIATKELREDAGQVDAVSDALRSSVPVAVFADRGTRVEIRQMAPDGTVALARSWRNDLDARRQAGTGLLQNPRVQVATPFQALLGRGGLDLRACVVVAALAGKGDVRITDIKVDAAEQGGRPARRLTISMHHVDAVLHEALATLPRRLWPGRVIGHTAQTRQLMWALQIEPLLTLN